MTNHSRAPWKRDGFEIDDAEGNLVAITVGESVGLDVESANADLMTAAPAMLAALEEISALLDASPSEGVTAQQRAIARGAALIAIRAARGEQVGTEARS